ncbi:MAG: tRNA uridine-5-carboxymethylaminomethyl(34) synthesis enzyme MnmG [Deltaproteobacteria bacterium RIFOXYA12_FULL_61_11]|nr:MAG: tRNA uridine-5-carboxymethylaminomethyl(34) synthesis enzyme MnmG [Deltaproteobacteria bacterium RIFOXYA12_FULL_61_11]
MAVKSEFEVIVVGGGHAGCEAALCTARLGHPTLLLTSNYDNIALMSCNPAVGGLAKGHLVRELDLLGGQMAKTTDLCAIQYRRLNTRKGAAVQSLRAQVDKRRYRDLMRRTIELQDGLVVREAEVSALEEADGRVVGVRTALGEVLSAERVILTCGTFLEGVCHIGFHRFEAGRVNDFATHGLSGWLRERGFRVGRLKTGTVPRLDAASVNLDGLEAQPGDPGELRFAYVPTGVRLPQVACHLTYTNQATHEVIRANLDRSPLFTGRITGIGPRYCPSIEDKVCRYPERERHQLFLEPEGLDTSELYVNGLPTSLPWDVQDRMLRTIPGLERARVLRYGYAVEYDYLPPTQLHPWLETRALPGLFIAGQLNGTSGYEEAAAQGLMAGLNAALGLRGKEPFVLGRAEAYIGVLLDDLVTRGTDEPYRMFTSRAEFRLTLREDSAEDRLLPLAAELGLVSREYLETYERRSSAYTRLRSLARETKIAPDSALGRRLRGESEDASRLAPNLYEALKRPEFTWSELGLELHDLGVEPDLLSKLAVEARYEGYLLREQREAARLGQLETVLLPDVLDYDAIHGLSNEVREKLRKVRPATLGQAGRIPGMTPAALSAVLIALRLRHKEGKKVRGS